MHTFTNVCFMSSLPAVRSFPRLDFDITKMSLTSGIEHQQTLICVQFTEEMHVDCNHFCQFLFLWSELLRRY